ncbi:outer dynein arm-docking complex subunit 4 isoform X2 [Uranotaenia lowii]|uniref:outer dynein arm-docking complex subunit 4 isoform X2 n=1 Tax=Uranotaenia lowii TaxID=190385 RepID=UPI00247910A1|nr:outer dynein arm-docking complex subunit 4 isoform X2 [Uranotaenia lowii]
MSGKTAVGILGGEDELLQSFVRVGMEGDDGHSRHIPRIQHPEPSSGGGHHATGAGGSNSAGGGSGGVGGAGSGTHAVNHPAPHVERTNTHHQLMVTPKVEIQRQHSEHFSDLSDKNAPTKYRNLFNEPIDMKKRRYFDEVYTDKDRAAAVSIGSFDIKQNLMNKRRQEQNQQTAIPEEADPSAILALGMREIKNRNLENAVYFLSKALEMNNNDQSALVARSKCYLQLGEPAKALQDAETALLLDKGNIRAIYQKAEALYYLGQFEHSLMFFHRGLKLRPELASFRLGVQKTQEAIENTIGSNPKSQPPPVKKAPKAEKPKPASTGGNNNGHGNGNGNGNGNGGKKPPLTQEEIERRAARRLLGDLYVDKEYLENLLKHPDLKKADTNTEGVSEYAKDAINFLNNRQEFWRQQKPCTSLNSAKIADGGGIPKWRGAVRAVQSSLKL